MSIILTAYVYERIVHSRLLVADVISVHGRNVTHGTVGANGQLPSRIGQKQALKLARLGY